MLPEEILDIIRAFFAAIERVLVALGIIKKNDVTPDDAA